MFSPIGISQWLVLSSSSPILPGINQFIFKYLFKKKYTAYALALWLPPIKRRRFGNIEILKLLSSTSAQIAQGEVLQLQHKSEVDIIEEDDDVVHNEINNELRNELLLPKKILLRGRADLITDNSVYELKCTSETSIEHYIQLAVYAWMWHMKYKNHPKESKKQFKLYNMKLNELYTLRATPQQLYSVVVALLKAKEQKIKKVDDDVFIEISHREIEKYQMMTEDVNVHCVPSLQNDLDYQGENEHA